MRLIVLCLLLSSCTSARINVWRKKTSSPSSDCTIEVQCRESGVPDDLYLSLSCKAEVRSLRHDLENRLGSSVALFADDGTEMEQHKQLSQYASDSTLNVNLVRQVSISFNGKPKGVTSVNKDDTFMTLWEKCKHAAKRIKYPHKPPVAFPMSKSGRKLYSRRSTLPTALFSFNDSQVRKLEDSLFDLREGGGSKAILHSVDFGFEIRPVMVIERLGEPDAPRSLENVRFTSTSANVYIAQFSEKDEGRDTQNSHATNCILMKDVRRNLEVQLGTRAILKTAASEPMEDNACASSYYTDGADSQAHRVEMHVQRYVVAKVNSKHAGKVAVESDTTFAKLWEHFANIVFKDARTIPKRVQALPYGNTGQKLYSSSSSLPTDFIAWSDAQVRKLSDNIIATRDSSGNSRVLYGVDFSIY